LTEKATHSYSPGSGKSAFASLALVRDAGIAFEACTTWHSALLDASNMLARAKQLDAANIPDWVFQPFCPKGCVDAGLCATGPVVFPPSLLG